MATQFSIALPFSDTSAAATLLLFVTAKPEFNVFYPYPASLESLRANGK